MRRALLVGLMVAFILLPFVAAAGTLENQDFQEYKYELVGTDGFAISNGIIYGQSTLYGICDMGCWVRLMDTGQTIAMQPGAYIIIEDGVMRPREF
jgi:hypothetical protein